MYRIVLYELGNQIRAMVWLLQSGHYFKVFIFPLFFPASNLAAKYRAPRPPTFPTFPTKQVGTSYFEENSPTFPTFYQFYENVI